MSKYPEIRQQIQSIDSDDHKHYAISQLLNDPYIQELNNRIGALMVRGTPCVKLVHDVMVGPIFYKYPKGVQKIIDDLNIKIEDRQHEIIEHVLKSML